MILYSDVPKLRLQRFGLPFEAAVTIWPATLITVLCRLAQKFKLNKLRKFLEQFREPVFDFFCSKRIKPCDVIVTMCGIGFQTAMVAQKKYGAKFGTERSSTHIRDQLNLLNSIGVPWDAGWNKTIEKEEKFYNVADFIVTPSSHCVASLESHGIPPAKIFRSSFGIDITQFPWSLGPNGSKLEFVFVGTWSLRKGANLLRSVIPHFANINFRHFGTLGDANRINDLPNFVHMGKVDQLELKNVYSTAHALILPSYEEGLAVVILQALASGLIVFCSDRSGGQDFSSLEYFKDRVVSFQYGNADALHRALRDNCSWVAERRSIATNADQIRTELSVQSYGKRYSHWLSQM